MRLTSRSLIAGTAASLFGVVALAGAAYSAGSSTLASDEGLNLGDDGLSLRIFELKDPNGDNSVGKVDVNDLDLDTKLVGIDYRVQNKKFYGVGDEGGIYIIDTKDADVTKVSQLSIELDGASFGVDFNPAADRLRVISDTGQNLRHDVNTPNGPTIMDGTLTRGTPPATATEVAAAAYTNNDLSTATATSLFDIDTDLNQVTLQSPANSGSLAATGNLGTGSQLIDARSVAGFDIQSKTESGATTSNTGYAVLRTSDTGRPTFYKVDLLTGDLSTVKQFDKQIADIAVRQP